MVAKVSFDGRITIPKALRDKLGITSKTKMLFEDTRDGVLIRPMNEQYFKSFMGILKGGNFKEEIKKYRKKEIELEERKCKIREY